MAASIRNNCATRCAAAAAARRTAARSRRAADLARPGDALRPGARTSLNSDFRSDTLDLSGNVRVTQGPMSIEAGAAKASDVRSENSRWTFEQAVHIVTSEADLQSDSASAAFVGGQIGDARDAEGSPAQFEQRGGTRRSSRCAAAPASSSTTSSPAS